MAAKLAELIQGKWKHPNILEAGSGNGLTVLLLRSMGFNAFGIDLDPKLSVYLMELCKIPVISARFEEFNPPGKYHLIYSSHVIEHCPNPFHFIKKAFDLLEDNGIFYLDTPDTYYYDKQLGRWHHFATRNPFEHNCLLGRVGLRLLSTEIGFKDIKIERYDDYMSQQAIMVKHKEK
jgi:2-polyprenyl-3-methyl-5-hydroxy-6-metoxy-1,4-benzoquinol methylase